MHLVAGGVVRNGWNDANERLRGGIGEVGVTLVE